MTTLSPPKSATKCTPSYSSAKIRASTWLLCRSLSRNRPGNPLLKLLKVNRIWAGHRQFSKSPSIDRNCYFYFWWDFFSPPLLLTHLPPRAHTPFTVAFFSSFLTKIFHQFCEFYSRNFNKSMDFIKKKWRPFFSPSLKPIEHYSTMILLEPRRFRQQSPKMCNILKCIPNSIGKW